MNTVTHNNNISTCYDSGMNKNINTVKIGNGTKVHYATENASVTFCNLWRGIRKITGAEATCQKCLDGVMMRDQIGSN